MDGPESINHFSRQNDVPPTTAFSGFLRRVYFKCQVGKMSYCALRRFPKCCCTHNNMRVIPQYKTEWTTTVLVLRMAHRKWEKTKQQPGTAGPGNMLGCCLISFHFLWVILSTSTVERGDQNVSPTPHTHSFSAGFRHIKEEFEEIFSEDDLKAMNHDELAFAWFS